MENIEIKKIPVVSFASMIMAYVMAVIDNNLYDWYHDPSFYWHSFVKLNYFGLWSFLEKASAFCGLMCFILLFNKRTYLGLRILIACLVAPVFLFMLLEIFLDLVHFNPIPP